MQDETRHPGQYRGRGRLIGFKALKLITLGAMAYSALCLDVYAVGLCGLVFLYVAWEE